jgi:hypothetical protein
MHSPAGSDAMRKLTLSVKLLIVADNGHGRRGYTVTDFGRARLIGRYFLTPGISVITGRQ